VDGWIDGIAAAAERKSTTGRVPSRPV